MPNHLNVDRFGVLCILPVALLQRSCDMCFFGWCHAFFGYEGNDHLFIESHWDSWTIINLFSILSTGSLLDVMSVPHFQASHCFLPLSLRVLSSRQARNVQGFCKMSNFQFDGDPNATRVCRTRSHHTYKNHVSRITPFEEKTENH